MPRVVRLFLSLLLASGAALAQTTTPPATAPCTDPQQVNCAPAGNGEQPAVSPQAAPAPVVQQPAPQPDQTPAAQAPPPSQQTGAEADHDAQSSEDVPGGDDSKDGKVKAEKADNDAPVPPDELHNPVLWHDPGDIPALDLYLGEGGKAGMPVPPFTFEAEDRNGTNPKFDARDANGRKWRVKLGPEARPEVTASRLMWAMGFYVNDDYVLESADVSGLHMKRGGNLTKDGHIEGARFARKPEGQKKIGIWEWRQNPFTDSREFNGLRVMMAVMNSWDLKDVNNAVYRDKKSGKDIFLVSDIGATFATNGIVLPIAHSKGDLESYRKSKFITRVTDTEVDFSTPKKPTGMLLKTLGATTKEYVMRSGLDWIGDNIPRKDARWMGSLLGQLSHRQLVDAFRAGGFPEDEIGVYVDIVESRILELKQL